ncbi:VanZ family protein [Arthrobacter sp. ISL-72]|uniref:VanZ family protein n=1 Tax=Arthrobacter sp. ISL-72 TaxID=2819114 RepID=UPI001BE8100C|nr:VanZ family protein [Arthrobacter sp. ISL-72]MBT2595488.1 VanZ family protein [Arthrobacter sp. ISL-72]
MRSRRRAQGLLALYLAAAGTAAFWPSPVDAPLSRQLASVLGRLHRLGAPEWFNYMLVEFCANVALFLPWGALLACLLTRNILPAAALSGFGASSIIELGQFFLLTQRHATWQDIGANTLGAVLGAALVMTIRSRTARRRRSTRNQA